MGQPTHQYFVRNTWVLYAVGAFAAVSRICIRLWLARRLMLDEIIMFLSLICWTVDTACIVVTVKKGTNQLTDAQRATISEAESNQREIGSKAFISAWYMYITMIWGCKLCVWLFYKKVTDRVAHPNTMRYSLYTLGATYFACILSISFVCHPLPRNWQIDPDPGRESLPSPFQYSGVFADERADRGPAQCTNGYHFVWIVGILNILTDFMLLAIPLPVVFRLRVSPSRKILLVGLFSLGLFVIIATTLRIYFTIAGGNIANMTFWSMIETCCGMVVSNAPQIKTIFTHRKPVIVAGANSSSYQLSQPTPHASSRDSGSASDEPGGFSERIVSSQNPTILIQMDVSYEMNERRLSSHRDGFKDTRDSQYTVGVGAADSK